LTRVSPRFYAVPVARALVATVLALALVPAVAHAQRRRTGRLIVICQQQGAEVSVDENVIGTIPIEPRDLEPGSHTVRVRMPGFTEFTEVVTIRRGEDSELEVELLAVSTVLRARSTPAGARVFVDGRFSGETPLELELLEGEHSVRLQHPGYREAIRSVRAQTGQTAELAVTLDPLSPEEDPRRVEAEPKDWYEKPWTWVAVGGGAVALALGIIVILVVTAPEDDQTDLFCMGISHPCFYTEVPP